MSSRLLRERPIIRTYVVIIYSRGGGGIPKIARTQTLPSIDNRLLRSCPPPTACTQILCPPPLFHRPPAVNNDHSLNLLILFFYSSINLVSSWLEDIQKNPLLLVLVHCSQSHGECYFFSPPVSSVQDQVWSTSILIVTAEKNIGGEPKKKLHKGT